MRVWCVRAEFGRYADDFRKGGYVGLDYDIDEPYPIGGSREDFVAIYRKYHPGDASNFSIGQQAAQIMRFCEMQAGDYVITPSEQVDELFHGVLEADADEAYRFEQQPADGCPYRHRRKVKWHKEPVLRRNFTVPFQNTMRSSLAVFAVAPATEFLIAVKAPGYELSTKKPHDPYKVALAQILKLDANQFEELVACLLIAMGFKYTLRTGKPGNGGVDVIGTLEMSDLVVLRLHVQAKRYQQAKISQNAVRDLRGRVPEREQGAIVTTSEFHQAAYEVAEEEGFAHIGLINGHKLVDLLAQHWQKIPDDFQTKLKLQVGLVRPLPTS